MTPRIAIIGGGLTGAAAAIDAASGRLPLRSTSSSSSRMSISAAGSLTARRRRSTSSTFAPEGSASCMISRTTSPLGHADASSEFGRGSRPRIVSRAFLSRRLFGDYVRGAPQRGDSRTARCAASRIGRRCRGGRSAPRERIRDLPRRPAAAHCARSSFWRRAMADRPAAGRFGRTPFTRARSRSGSRRQIGAVRRQRADLRRRVPPPAQPGFSRPGARGLAPWPAPRGASRQRGAARPRRDRRRSPAAPALQRFPQR